MIRTLVFTAAIAFSPIALAQDHTNHNDHAAHEHDTHDHSAHEQQGNAHADHAAHNSASVSLSRTPEIEAALQAGGEPVVVEVLGVVCDFCAKAMNRTFGRRDDVSAVHVDLDAKTLNLVLASGEAMDNAEIERVVIRSGYKTKAIHRGEQILGDNHASDHS